MKQYGRFNLFCILLSGFFVIAIFWQWRFVFAEVKPAAQIVYADRKDEVVGEKVLVKIEKKEKLEKQNTDIKIEEKESAPKQEIKEEVVEQLDTAFNELQKEIYGVKYNLNVPSTSQAPERNWEQPWQDACEEAAILMLDAFYKGYGLSPIFARDEMQKMINWEESKGWGGSININKIKYIFENYLTTDKTPRIIEDPTAEQIKAQIRKGNPVLVVADGRVLDNKWYSGDGPEYHALIVRGYTNTHFITNDPGVNRGRNFSFSIQNLMSSIRDWNDGNVTTGRKVVLVLE